MKKMITCALALVLGMSACGGSNETSFSAAPPPVFYTPEEVDGDPCLSAYAECIQKALTFPGGAIQPQVDRCVKEMERCDQRGGQ